MLIFQACRAVEISYSYSAGLSYCPCTKFGNLEVFGIGRGIKGVALVVF